MTKRIVFLAMLTLLLASSVLAADAGHAPSFFERLLGDVWAWLNAAGASIMPNGMGAAATLDGAGIAVLPGG